ncbi:zinc metalloproteinase nas-6-like isoform X2 [Plodia interpunctella]|uniref:zinc metalloproteinase nas-6-like isoform X2 n=1 Tax=Plodia interpunctella TaxID=58824 RepID=UPI002368EFC2|nr:zinc metalloproteinase nas-6-like isoform X2 [Plodia interpunctella]
MKNVLNPTNTTDTLCKITDLQAKLKGLSYTEAEMAKYKIWPNGIVPYYIDRFSYDPVFCKKLDIFLETTSRSTAVQFLKLSAPPTDESYRWVYFLNRRSVANSGGCTTKNFTYEGVQRVVIGHNSPFNGELYEAVLALLGIPPQHNAPDRDDYITVNYDNILPDKVHMFEKLKKDEWLFDGLEYDYFSAGHYSLHKYTRNGKATIVPKSVHLREDIGDGIGLTFNDFIKIHILYYFISQNANVMKQENCKKMFKPGPKFNSFQPKALSARLPLRKQQKYLIVNDDNGEKKSKDDSLRSKTTKSRPVKRKKFKKRKVKL